MNAESISTALESLGLIFRGAKLRQARGKAVVRELETCVTSITDIIECQSGGMSEERFRAFQSARQDCLRALVAIRAGKATHCRECGDVGCALCKGAA